MSQPEWKLLYSTDTEALYTDATGVYPPELEILEEINDAPASERFQVFRVTLDKRTPGKPDDDGVTPWFEGHPEWYDKDIPDAARTCGQELAEVIEAFCSDDPRDLAYAYGVIAGHWGWQNFDHYPLTIPEWRGEEWPDWRAVPAACPTCGHDRD